MTGRDVRHVRAVAGLAVVAAVAALTVAQFPEPSGEVERTQSPGSPLDSPDSGTTVRDGAGDARGNPALAVDSDTSATLAEHRALATRNVGRSDERLARLDADVARERREARTAEIHAAADARRAEQLAVVEARREEERRAAEEAARKAAEEEAAREAAAKATPAPKATTGGGTAQGTASPNVVLPIAGDYRLTGRFGQCGRHWANCHTGLDFAAPSGTTVRAVMAGRVIEAGRAGAYGNRIVVDHGNGTTSSYSHLSEYIRTGGRVDAGEAIGRVGSTGNSTGPHLHLEIRIGGSPTDPDAWLRERGITP